MCIIWIKSILSTRTSSKAKKSPTVHTGLGRPLGCCPHTPSFRLDLLCGISESMIKHEPDKKSITCTRILSSHGVTWGATKACYWECQVDHDAVNTYGHFLSAINIDLNYSAFGSRNTCETNKKSIFCTRVSSLLGGQKNSPLKKP